MAYTIMTKKSLVEFLAPFSDVNSLLLSIDETQTTVSSGTYAMYIRRTCEHKDGSIGKISISDLSVLRKFLRTCKAGDEITLKQQAPHQLCYITGGNKKFHMPGLNEAHIDSQQHIKVFNKIIGQSEETGFKQWFKQKEIIDLSASGKVSTKELSSVTEMLSVVGKDELLTLTLDPTSSNMDVKAGKKVRGRMFVSVEMTDVTGDISVTSLFDNALAELIPALPAGEITLHMGEDSPLVIASENGDLIVVTAQDVQEGWG